MDDYQLVVSVAELMVKEKVLTDFGLKILNNNIESDMATLTADDPEKLTRTALYFTLLYNMAVLYAGYCVEHPDPRSERLRHIAGTVVDYIPKLLRGLDDKYLEVYHGAKVKSFTQENFFEDYFPQHPEEQKLIDKMNNHTKDTDMSQTTI